MTSRALIAGVTGLIGGNLATLEIDLPPLSHRALFLFARSPEELDLLSEGVKRHGPPRRIGLTRAGWQRGPVAREWAPTD